MSHNHNACWGYIYSLASWFLIISHTIVVHYPRLCHDLDSGHVGKGLGQYEYIAKNICNSKILDSHNCYPWPKGLGSGPYLFAGNFDLNDTSHNFVHGPMIAAIAIFFFFLIFFISKPQYDICFGKPLEKGYFKISPYNMLNETSR